MSFVKNCTSFVKTTCHLLNSASNLSARPKGHDMKPIDSYFIRKRKASGIASSPTSPDHGPADKVVRCINVDESI